MPVALICVILNSEKFLLSAVPGSGGLRGIILMRDV